MNFHDYQLRGYSVMDFGDTIVLDLVYEYPDQLIRESKIEFSGVSLYHFTHTAGAIITDITPCPIERILSEYSSQIPEWHRLQSVTDWPGSLDKFILHLEKDGMSGWQIESAIGFEGFIIGKQATQKTEPSHPANPRNAGGRCVTFGNNMNTVFVVQHLHRLPSGEEDTKLIGVYRSKKSAFAAIKQLATQPGFCDTPKINDNQADDDDRGFHITSYELDECNWKEGFSTCFPSDDNK